MVMQRLTTIGLSIGMLMALVTSPLFAEENTVLPLTEKICETRVQAQSAVLEGEEGRSLDHTMKMAGAVMVADAQGCEASCSEQAKTCLRGCDNLSDKTEQAKCYRGCESGQVACRGRCQ